MNYGESYPTQDSDVRWVTRECLTEIGMANANTGFVLLMLRNPRVQPRVFVVWQASSRKHDVKNSSWRHLEVSKQWFSVEEVIRQRLRHNSCHPSLLFSTTTSHNTPINKHATTIRGQVFPYYPQVSLRGHGQRLQGALLGGIRFSCL